MLALICKNNNKIISPLSPVHRSFDASGHLVVVVLASVVVV